MKKVLLICFTIFCLGALIDVYIKDDSKPIEIFDYPANQSVIVDKETGVQYIMIGRSAMSVRLDADGKPMVDRGAKQ